MPGSRPRRVASLRTASSSRCAALPVGAARAMSGGGAPRATACWSSSARRRATVRRLPRPWSAPDDGDPAQDGGRGGQRLQVVRVRRLGVRFGKQLREPSAQECQVDVDHLGLGPGQELCRHQALIEPKPIQVQVRSRQVQRVAIPDERAQGHCVEPCCGVGPWQCVDVGRQVGVSTGGLADGLQVDAHVAESRRPDGEGDPEADVLRSDAGELCQPVRDVDV